MINKIITNQDAMYKLSSCASGETSINLSTQIVNYVTNVTEPGNQKLQFIINKSDYIKALGFLVNVLPLYTSTSQGGTKVYFSASLFQSLLLAINNFFGESEEKVYETNLIVRSDGRYYLNKLINNGFNIRDFLISYFSVLQFSKTDTGANVIRLITGPIKSGIEQMTAEERQEAFFDYIDTHKKGQTRKNYKQATIEYSSVNKGKPIQDNIDKLGYVGHLCDLVDLKQITELYDNVVADPNNATWHQTCSATVGTYRDFIIAQYNSLDSIKHTSTIELAEMEVPQIIYYGAPGTGKSKTIKREVEDRGMIHFRTTFHPDSDYSTFVGCYKPTMVEAPVRDGSGHEVNSATDNEKKRISYSFIPQAFTKAYCEAWNNFSNEEKEPVFLIIEEINRGNCAQIFGDIFQLLDRKDDGYSDYPIDADEDLKKFMLTGAKENGSQWLVNKDGIKDGKLCLPPNLHIWATMNTSDQSLFPIDSAFKRRWEWKYVPISNAGKNWKISVNGNEYDWWSFLEKINTQIDGVIHSEDKKLGYFFCKADGNNIISAEKFVGKVLFYIYNDVFKDYELDKNILNDASDGTQLLFQSYFMPDGKPREEKVEAFLKNLGLSAVGNSSQSTFKVHIDGVDVEEPTQFETYIAVLKKMGMANVEPIAGGMQYTRFNCPLVSNKEYDEIKNSQNFVYVEVDGFYVVKGIDKDTMKRLIQLCADRLGHNVSME